MKECYECGTPVSDDALVCPNCGAPLKKAPAAQPPVVPAPSQSAKSNLEQLNEIVPYLPFASSVLFLLGSFVFFIQACFVIRIFQFVSILILLASVLNFIYKLLDFLPKISNK